MSKTLPLLQVKGVALTRGKHSAFFNFFTIKLYCRVNLDLYKARDVMKSPVLTIHSIETVAHLARMLKDTDHGGFPVVKYDEETRSELCSGMITRYSFAVFFV